MHGSGYSHASKSIQDPASAGQRFSCDTNRETPVCKKKVLSALIPAIAGLATIAVESLNSFLQRKRNKAMANGMSALKKDQSQDIVSTVNGIRNRTLQIEKLLTGQDFYTLQIAHMAPDVTGRMTFIRKLNLYVHSVLERQVRLYEWLL